MNEFFIEAVRKECNLMTRKWIVHLILGVAMAASLMACSDSGEADPYQLVTLKELTYSPPVSKNFKYKLENPNIIALYRNLGLIRDGNQIEFIAARSLADRLEGHTDGALELAVEKKFSPFVHFKVERIVAEGDTMFPSQAGGIAFPQITTAEEYGIDVYEEQDIDNIPYNRTGTIRALKDKKIHVTGKIVAEKIEGQTVYYLEGENSKLRIGDMSDGIGLMIQALHDGNYLFDGGVILTEPEPYADRMKNQVAGTIAVQYLMYGDRLITG